MTCSWIFNRSNCAGNIDFYPSMAKNTEKIYAKTYDQKGAENPATTNELP